MSTTSDCRFEEITHSTWKESFESCFQITDLQQNKSEQESVLNPNYRMVPESKYWVTYNTDPAREILHRKKIIKDHVIPDFKNNKFSNEEIRKFTTSLPMCIPITSAFKPRSGYSYCSLSKQIQE